jgi:hypothetical protein
VDEVHAAPLIMAGVGVSMAIPCIAATGMNAGADEPSLGDNAACCCFLDLCVARLAVDLELLVKGGRRGRRRAGPVRRRI